MNKTIAALRGLLFTLLLGVQKVACQECGANGDCDKHERWYVYSTVVVQYRAMNRLIDQSPSTIL